MSFTPGFVRIPIHDPIERKKTDHPFGWSVFLYLVDILDTSFRFQGGFETVKSVDL